MSELNNIEELKRRKEQLLLEEEVARLERKKSLRKAAGWSWAWVAPLTLLGAYLLIGGAVEGKGAPILFSVFALAPVAMKLYFKR